MAVGADIEGVAVAEEEAEAAAVFFMGVGGAGGAARRSAGLDEGALAPTVLLLAGALDGAAGLADLAAETFFAAGAACLAAGVFLTAGLAAGLALAAGFFTVTGSFDELERVFNGCLLPRNAACGWARRLRVCQGARQWRTPGLYPRK